MRADPVQRLREFMFDRGLTQEGFAKLIGSRQGSVSRILDRSKGVGLELGSAIEQATKNWEKGPIRAHEWARKPRRAKRAA